MGIDLNAVESLSRSKDTNLDICYAYIQSSFGRMLWASSDKGICFVGFETDDQIALACLKKRFSTVRYNDSKKSEYEHILVSFLENKQTDFALQFNLQGSVFEMKVWRALLQIPFGHTCSYGQIAAQIGSPNAYRAVGSAIGRNPISLLIPCHRVLGAGKQIGGYMWGIGIKQELLNWEKKQTAND